MIMRSFLFLRHGETDWNVANRIMGNQDVPLNAVGLKQAQMAVERLRLLSLECVVVSPLARALQTAEIIASTLQLPLSQHRELREAEMGELEGVLVQKTGNAFAEWMKGATPKNAETAAHFIQRTQEAVGEILDNYKNPLIVSHGGVGHSLMHTLNITPRWIDNAVPYRFQKDNRGKWTIEEA